MCIQLGLLFVLDIHKKIYAWSQTDCSVANELDSWIQTQIIHLIVNHNKKKSLSLSFLTIVVQGYIGYL